MNKNQFTIVEPPRFAFTIIGKYDEEEADVYTVASRGERKVFDVTNCVTEGEEAFFELCAPCEKIRKTVVSYWRVEQACQLLLGGAVICKDEGNRYFLFTETDDVCKASQMLLTDLNSGEDMELWSKGLPKFSFYVYDEAIKKGVLVELDYAHPDSRGFSVTQETLRFEGYALLPGYKEPKLVSGYYSFKDGCGVLRLKNPKNSE